MRERRSPTDLRPPPVRASPPRTQVGALRELVLHQDIGWGLKLDDDSLAPLAPVLRRLHAVLLAETEWYQGCLRVDVRLQAFTALQDLRLTAFGLALDPAVRLPPSLTGLALGREVVSHTPVGVALSDLVRGSGGGLGWAGLGGTVHAACLRTEQAAPAAAAACC